MFPSSHVHKPNGTWRASVCDTSSLCRVYMYMPWRPCSSDGDGCLQSDVLTSRTGVDVFQVEPDGRPWPHYGTRRDEINVPAQEPGFARPSPTGHGQRILSIASIPCAPRSLSLELQFGGAIATQGIHATVCPKRRFLTVGKTAFTCYLSRTAIRTDPWLRE